MVAEALQKYTARIESGGQPMNFVLSLWCVHKKYDGGGSNVGKYNTKPYEIIYGK